MCLEQNCHSSSLMTIFTSYLTLKNFSVILSYSKSSKYDVLFYKSYMPWHSFPAKIPIIVLFFMVQQPLMGQGLLTIEASWLQSNTPHSVGLLQTSDHPDAETSTWQQTTLTTDTHACPGRIRTLSSSKRMQADPSLRLHNHWDQPPSQ